MMLINTGRTGLSWGDTNTARGQTLTLPLTQGGAGDSGLLHTASETYLATKALSTRTEVKEDSYKCGLELTRDKIHIMWQSFSLWTVTICKYVYTTGTNRLFTGIFAGDILLSWPFNAEAL